MHARVMIIEGDPDARAEQAAALRTAGHWVAAEASTGEEALRLVRAMAPDVVVIDASLAGMGAGAAVRRLRELAPGPLGVVATARADQADRLGQLVTVGAAAFVVKGKPADLVAAVEAVTGGSGLLSAEVSRAVLDEVLRRFDEERHRSAELEQTVAHLRATSVTDWLTGLKNHGYFFDRLNEEMERARRYDRRVALAVVDLDDFKQVNDTFGHSTGDAVLRTIGEVLRAHLRDADLACRIGGEEFGLLLPETSAGGAAQACERIRQAIAGTQIPAVGAVTVSIGVAVFPDDAQGAGDLYEAADRALYQAKHAGKDQVRMGGTPIGEPIAPPSRTVPGAVVGSLLGALRMRNPDLVDRSARVADLASALGKNLELAVADLAELRLAALLHDIGMLGVPDGILLRPGGLTSGEWVTVRHHPHAGHDLVVSAVGEVVAEIVLAHHENIDGSGYPRGLVGEGIPLLARIVRVCDAYVAATSDLPYRAARPAEQALTEIRGQTGVLFDSAVVEALTQILDASEKGEVVPLPISAAG